MPVADVSRAGQVVAAVWSLVSVSGLFVALKILARARRRMRWWWDDYLMLVSWACLLAASAFLTDATTYGLGRHVQFLDADQRSAVLRLGYISAVLTIAASVWSKVSFALFLLRISSSGCTEWIRRGIVAIIVSLNTILATAIAMLILSCRPTEKMWRTEIDGTCLDDRVKVSATIGLAAYSGVTDLILAFLPLKIIWYLPVNRRDKIGLVAVMSLGVFAAAASFIKCAYIHLFVAEDFSFDGWILVFWAIFEPTLTIILASIPVIRPLLRDLLRSLLTRRDTLTSDSQRHVRTESASTGNNELGLGELPRTHGSREAALGEEQADKGDEERGEGTLPQNNRS